jgi:hypothetical protein
MTPQDPAALYRAILSSCDSPDTFHDPARFNLPSTFRGCFKIPDQVHDQVLTDLGRDFAVGAAVASGGGFPGLPWLLDPSGIDARAQGGLSGAAAVDRPAEGGYVRLMAVPLPPSGGLTPCCLENIPSSPRKVHPRFAELSGE